MTKNENDETTKAVLDQLDGKPAEPEKDASKYAADLIDELKAAMTEVAAMSSQVEGGLHARAAQRNGDLLREINKLITETMESL